MFKICRHGLLTVAVLFELLPEHLSAQLLSKLLSPTQSVVQPVLTAVTDVVCSIPLLSSPKLDAAVQGWARRGEPGRLRVIVSAAPGLLATVKSLVLGTSGLLL